MHNYSRWLAGGFLTIASWSFLSSAAIANPRAVSIPAHLPVNRLSRDLTRSPSEDFFRQGQARLEREIRHLAKTQELSMEDLLQVSPDGRLAPEALEQAPPINPRLDKRNR
ncbi:MAG: hypothetical protein NW224_25905 [Leptolyngbyaceae cyanobacterium bins.302]|nr:hypothetical protein [Leptolyngbyaceae cyanobacterium bins.302]